MFPSESGNSHNLGGGVPEPGMYPDLRLHVFLMVPLLHQALLFSLAHILISLGSPSVPLLGAQSSGSRSFKKVPFYGALPTRSGQLQIHTIGGIVSLAPNKISVNLPQS